ncbi:hypothetical protein MMC07_004871 [Pseudocyphellaria aurata]|nr:hypothetical protein [Pseudocyphellaria aurata]
MVKIGPPSPALNTLDVLQRYTYALTARETWQVINFFHEELLLVNVDDIQLEDRQCDICTGEFADDLHRAVKLPCGHIFGMKCIQRWLTPFKTGYALLEGNPSLGANNCPKCRRVFFPRQSYLDSPNAVEGRIRFWDLAYAHVGIALSDSERRIRADLLRYISTSGYLDRTLPSDLIRPIYIEKLHQQLRSFSRHLKSHPLTPVQEHLRSGLEEIALRGFQTRNDPDGVAYGRDDQGELFFEARHGWDPVPREGDEEEQSDEEGESEEHEESDVFVEDDTEEMRFFRALFR